MKASLRIFISVLLYSYDILCENKLVTDMNTLFTRSSEKIPGRVTGFSQVGIVPDDAVGLPVFSGSPVSPDLSFQRCSIFTSITLIGSHDLDVKSRPNLLTHSLTRARGRPAADEGLSALGRRREGWKSGCASSASEREGHSSLDNTEAKQPLQLQPMNHHGAVCPSIEVAPTRRSPELGFDSQPCQSTLHMYTGDCHGGTTALIVPPGGRARSTRQLQHPRNTGGTLMCTEREWGGDDMMGVGGTEKGRAEGPPTLLTREPTWGARSGMLLWGQRQWGEAKGGRDHTPRCQLGNKPGNLVNAIVPAMVGTQFITHRSGSAACMCSPLPGHVDPPCRREPGNWLAIVITEARPLICALPTYQAPRRKHC
ncbi:hypothetical protein PR048_008059 [Dryococelus australis]|uniref:Uncharacterized protein n=1 Tax=Dryococelus australis TaxID=614101 RepID=A0ABQ9HW09_9NEOP|nr:hypothetical protein PR048_008059 [Dryococelus australis]